MLRTIRQVPDEADRKYLRDWARDEFKRNKSATDQVETGSDSDIVIIVLIDTLTCPASINKCCMSVTLHMRRTV